MSDQERRDSRQTEMSLNAEPQAPPSDSTPGETLEWVSHPVKRKPLVSAAVTVFILACCFITYISTNSTWFAGLALAILFGSLAKFYFPTRYRLSSTGVTVRTTTQTLNKDWSIYRSFYPDRNGVLLSPFVEPSRLENFRGLYLIFNNNAADVVAFVRRHVHTESSAPGNGVSA